MFTTIFLTANGLLAAACLIGRYWTDIQMGMDWRSKNNPVLDADDHRNPRSHDICPISTGQWDGPAFNPATGNAMLGQLDTSGNIYGSSS